MKIETPILKRLGPIPFWRGERKCLDSLELAYKRAMDAAKDAILRTAEGHSAQRKPRTATSES